MLEEVGVAGGAEHAKAPASDEGGGAWVIWRAAARRSNRSRQQVT